MFRSFKSFVKNPNPQSMMEFHSNVKNHPMTQYVTRFANIGKQIVGNRVNDTKELMNAASEGNYMDKLEEMSSRNPKTKKMYQKAMGAAQRVGYNDDEHKKMVNEIGQLHMTALGHGMAGARDMANIGFGAFRGDIRPEHVESAKQNIQKSVASGLHGFGKTASLFGSMINSGSRGGARKTMKMKKHGKSKSKSNKKKHGKSMKKKRSKSMKKKRSKSMKKRKN